MTMGSNAGTLPAHTIALPDAKRRLIAIDSDIAKIKAQLAAADLTRQAKGTRIDPVWFHRAKTALRHLRRERAELQGLQPSGSSRKDTLKDAIIAIVRPRFEADAWSSIIEEAHARRNGEAR